MVLTLQDLFKLSEQHKQKHGTRFRVTVSFIEVYNENIRDLLSEVDEFLDLREDPIKGPVISGVTEVEVRRSESGGEHWTWDARSEATMLHEQLLLCDERAGRSEATT